MATDEYCKQPEKRIWRRILGRFSSCHNVDSGLSPIPLINSTTSSANDLSKLNGAAC